LAHCTQQQRNDHLEQKRKLREQRKQPQQQPKETAAEASEATELEMVKAKLRKTQDAIKESGFAIPVDIDGYL